MQQDSVASDEINALHLFKYSETNFAWMELMKQKFKINEVYGFIGFEDSIPSKIIRCPQYPDCSLEQDMVLLDIRSRLAVIRILKTIWKKFLYKTLL